MSEHTVIASSYVFHKGQCFNVSTANRESSAALAHGHIYAETLVWECDYGTGKRGKLVGGGEGTRGSIRTHLAICERLHETGNADEPSDT